MIVVSDTTPLNYLVVIGAVNTLPALFVEVFVPKAVVRELNHAKAPQSVQRWAANPPGWLRVEDPVTRLESTIDLDDGEADAISLAKERGISNVLIDEYRGRKIATAEGLLVLPTLAVLELAAERNLLDLPSTVEALRRTSYRVRKEMIDAALARDAARKSP
jgi:predicted nucleic acid-binding protein